MNLTIEQGTTVAVVGPSGSGKTTLLSLIGGLDRVDKGRLVVDGRNLHEASNDVLVHYRRELVGFIFQFYNLLATLTAQENVELGLQFHQLSSRQRRKRARKYLEQVGLGDRLDRFPSRLSGGEQQRVAVARALARQPKLILADEPTGNLDQASSLMVAQMIRNLQREQGTTCVIVTHDHELANMADEIVQIRDGQVFEQAQRLESTSTQV